jgi:hypothetical protein
MSLRSILLLSIALLLVLLLAGCGAETISSPSPSPTIEATPTPTPEPSPTPETSPSVSGTQTISGFLIDQKCGEAGTDTYGNDIVAHPEKHTVKCLKARSASGYGMMLFKGGTWHFYKFDAAGSKAVKRWIVDKTTKTKDMNIAVKGTIEGDLIKVKTVLAYGLK